METSKKKQAKSRLSYHLSLVTYFLVMFCHIIISGFVQGVGYRQFVKKTAQKFGLNGWAKNLPRSKAAISDGRVEVGLTGSKKTIEEAIKSFKKGPFLSDIKDVKVEWEDKEPDFNGFEIIV